jgi:hypothetical protein
VSVRRCRYEFRTGQRAVIYCLDVEKFQDANGVAAYYGVHAKHGSLDDFVAFMQHARSDPEFYRDWYVWSDTRPKNHRDGIVFPGQQKTTWTFDRRAGQSGRPEHLAPLRPRRDSQDHGQPT